MIIAGVSAGLHDGAVTITRDGEILYSIASERVTGIKKQQGITKEVWEYALRQAGIHDVDVIAFSDYVHSDYFSINTNPILHRIYENNHLNLNVTMGAKKYPGIAIPHHAAHAAAAYYTSPYTNAMCYSMDASGGPSLSNNAIYRGDGESLTFHSDPQNMVGHLYDCLTWEMGFGEPHLKAGSMMGHAAYGTPLDSVVSNIDYYVEQTIAEHANIARKRFSGWLREWSQITGFSGDIHSRAALDITATAQLVFQESVLRSLSTIEGNLCLSGGSFLNCPTNTLIRERHTNVHHYPACGDDGHSTGAALYVAHNILREPRRNNAAIQYSKPAIPQNMDYLRVARMIADGAIIGWFDGGSEVGPRALGNRSIFADPRNPHIKDILNNTVKRREWFRPFACSVLAEHASEWFSPDKPSPYMLYSYQSRHPDIVPGVTHVDGSSRIQTVTTEPIRGLLEAFYQITGVPMLLNTSLNGAGPIVETDSQLFAWLRETMTLDAVILPPTIFVRDIHSQQYVPSPS